MDNSKTGKQKWLDAGYDLFGQIGPEALNVEHLSILLKKSRSSFYHHFGEAKFFESDLLEYHLHRFEEMAEGVNQCQNFDPDLIKLTIQYNKELLFQRQLMIHEAVSRYKMCFLVAKEKTESKVYRIWADYMRLMNNNPSGFSLYQVVRDFYLLHYEQDDSKNINAVVLDIQQLIKDFQPKKQ